MKLSVRLSWVAFPLLLLAGCGHKATRPCDGSIENCDLRYDEVTYAATHDAFAYADGGPVSYQFPNQDLPIPDQLAAGIRMLGIRPSPYYGTDPTQQDVVYVTHNGQQFMGTLGEEPLLDILTEVKSFLDANPSEVISLLSESLVTPQQIAAVFTQAGLDSYLVSQNVSDAWPTLQELIDAGTRLIFFNDSQDSSRPAWQLYMWDFIVDTNYNITDQSQFTCAFYRGTPTNSIYFLNEFIYKDYGAGILTADPGNAAVANDESFIVKRATQCQGETNRIPNVIYVDFYREGNVVGAVNELNAMSR